MTPVSPLLIELLGWVATAVFVGSYFFKRAELLVRVQMAGAVIWVAYGLLMRAPPVVVANLLVLGAAGWKAWQVKRGARASALPDEAPGQQIAALQGGVAGDLQ
jgi:hypothetical protein